MTAAVETPPVVSITDPEHKHTRTCYWDCREARWQCNSPAAATATRPAPRGR